MTSASPAALPAAITDRWACPRCRAAALGEDGIQVRCGACGSVFEIHAGFPLFHTGHRPPAPPPAVELSVIVMALNEAGNVAVLLRDLERSLGGLGIAHEVLVVDGGSTDGTPEVARAGGGRLIPQRERGYGRALAEGFAAARGRFVITMDADLSHPAPFVEELWRARDRGELVVASRFVPGARFDAPRGRKVLSRLLNGVSSRVLAMPVHDLSSGFRLYHAEALRGIRVAGVHFEALEEILIKVFMDGWRLAEIPFHYASRREGSSKAHLVAFGLSILRTLHAMWRLRTSIASADYDGRAYDSVIPLQRWWQRSRHRVVTAWAARIEGAVLDAGCGSSRILADLPDAVGLDVSLGKLRYARHRGAAVVEGSIFALPFRDASFAGAVCSQVIEHLPGDADPFAELARVVRPGGHLIIGTPDYGRPWWPLIERVYQAVHPHGYADEHITHYTNASLRRHLEQAGFTVLAQDTILGAELNLLARRR
jgi:dolichol-phosphate mannosyltransferase